MQPNLSTVSATQPTTMQPAQQIEKARHRVQTALSAAADEQPSFALLDDIARSLTQAMRDLDGLAITVAVLSRKKAIKG